MAISTNNLSSEVEQPSDPPQNETWIVLLGIKADIEMHC